MASLGAQRRNAARAWLASNGHHKAIPAATLELIGVLLGEQDEIARERRENSERLGRQLGRLERALGLPFCGTTIPEPMTYNERLEQIASTCEEKMSGTRLQIDHNVNLTVDAAKVGAAIAAADAAKVGAAIAAITTAFATSRARRGKK